MDGDGERVVKMSKNHSPTNDAKQFRIAAGMVQSQAWHPLCFLQASSPSDPELDASLPDTSCSFGLCWAGCCLGGPLSKAAAARLALGLRPLSSLCSFRISASEAAREAASVSAMSR